LNSSTPRPGGGYAWYVVAVLLLAYTLSFIDRMILSLLVGPIRADLGISDTQMSLLMGFAFAIFYSVLGIPLGWLADRGSRRGLIVAGVAAWSVMTAICGLAKGYVGLFLARIGVGLPGLLVALLIALTVREPERSGPKAGVEKGEFTAFLKSHPAAIAAHFISMSLIALVMYGAMAWIPQFLHRTYAMPVHQAGLWFGGATALCGAAGLLLGGAMADGLYRRGRKDAHLRIIRWNAVGLIPLLIGMALAPSLGIALALMILTMLIGTIHGGVAGAALQMITPSRLRARMVALYFLVANLIGLGCGPTAMALVTDQVFGDDMALRYAIALVTALAMPMAILAATLGMKPFARAAEAAEAAAT
jgi:MFS family permease